MLRATYQMCIEVRRNLEAQGHKDSKCFPICYQMVYLLSSLKDDILHIKAIYIYVRFTIFNQTYMSFKKMKINVCL